MRRQLEEKEQQSQALRDKLTLCQATIEENRLLRDKLKNKEEQFVQFKKTLKDKILSIVVENHRLKRN